MTRNLIMFYILTEHIYIYHREQLNREFLTNVNRLTFDIGYKKILRAKYFKFHTIK